MDEFLNALKAQAAGQLAALGQPRLAIVTSVDPGTATARVTLQPEGVLTGWLPLATAWVGAGWGLACPPAPGDQVLVIPEAGDMQPGFIVARLWSTQAPAPAAPVGEFWLVHCSGSSLKLLNDGTVHIQGDLHVSGDVFDHHGSLDQLRGHYNEHSHADPQGGKTATPTEQD